MFFFLVLIASIVFLDQISKFLVIIYLKNVGSVSVIPGVLRFTYVENDGAAFGMLDDHRWVFMVLSTVAIVGLLIYLWKKPPESMLCKISLAFLVGGGIGNMIDRCLYGYVVDFIDFCAFPKIWYFVFNIADSFVCIGAAILMAYLVIETVRETKAEKNEKIAVMDASDSENDVTYEARDDE